MKIKNCPNEAWNYEFIVAYNFSDGLVYYAYTTNGFEAAKMAHEIENGIVIHNVRIQGCKKEKPMKTYIFSGVWTYTCEARSREEAEEMFNDAEISEFQIDFDFCNVDKLED